MQGTRLWCFKDLKEWLEKNEGKLFWLMGGGGTGKRRQRYGDKIDARC